MDHRTVFTFTDEEIDESSGLVAGDQAMFTVNDSGDGPVVYVVDPTSGDTLGVMTYSSGEVTDVEALAPGRDALWVGDIGDNNRQRLFVEVFRVVPEADPADLGQSSDVSAASYRLAYPDGPRDAETLLVHPKTDRLYVVSKSLFGGTVYAAPRKPDARAVNQMTEVGKIPGLLTDGAFFPDGRHVVVRGYDSATIYTFPAMQEVADFTLPEQEQGEAVAVDRNGRIFISTEGARTEVLEVLLPRATRAELAPDAAAPVESTMPVEVGQREDPARPHGWRGADGVVAWGGAAVLVGAFALRLFLRSSRRRSRRRR